MGICPELSCPNVAEDIVDPDMHGIGVIIAFVATAVLALFTAIAAVIRGGLPDYQYRWLDKKLLSTLPATAKKTPKERPENLGYQLFLLTLSDQILVTGMCYAITMYARICSLSGQSFYIGSILVRLSSTVHLATLTVLKLHFLEHRRQAFLRCGLMTVFLALLFAVTFMTYYAWERDGTEVTVCELYATKEPPRFIVADCLAIFLTVSLIYWNALRSIKPRGDSSNFWTTSTLYLIYSLRDRKTDVDAYLLKKQARFTSKHETTIDALRQKPSLFRVFYLVAPVLLSELNNSIFLELLICTGWFLFTVSELGTALFQSFNSEILEFKFGQIMPILLLLVYGVTALEVANIKQPQTTAVEKLSAHEPIVLTVNTRGDGLARPGRLSGETCGTAGDDKQPYGQSPSVSISERPAHIVEVGMKHAAAATRFTVVVTALFVAGMMALYIYFFTWMVMALMGLMLFLFLGELAMDLVRMHQMRAEHQRNRDKASVHPMNGLVA